MAAPFGWSDRGGPLGRRFARAVFIGDPKRRTGDPIGVFHEIYGLTPGETRLTLLLLADCSLEEAARLLGISRSTARSVLKRVFQKTDTKRQSGLVRLMFTGFAQVRPDDLGRPDPLRAGSRL
jgi:DNA-binding CsgD family transcriptional regulator